MFMPGFDDVIRKAREQGCTTILTGEGGDEWLVPPVAYVADRLRACDLIALSRLGRAWRRYYPGMTGLTLLRFLLWQWGARGLLRASAGSALARWDPKRLRRVRRRRLLDDLPAWVAPDALLRDQLGAWWMETTPEVAPRDLYSRSREHLLVHPNISVNFEDAFHGGARHGIPIRMPFYDVDLVEFLYSLDPSVLLHNGQIKWLAQEFLAPRVPQLARRWPKTVYGDALWALVVRSQGLDALSMLGGTEVLENLGIVDGQRLRETLEKGSIGLDAAEIASLWHALNLESWLGSRILR
jgi:asparagine synthetase B (glutamine-hydrolysing)